MDLYRYFHPHHNPRLKNTPLRLLEIGELGQAAAELKRALERAEIRAVNCPTRNISGEHLADVLVAIDFVVESLDTLAKAHPGDESEDMTSLLKERQKAPGWENWVHLLRQRLHMVGQYENEAESPRRAASSK